MANSEILCDDKQIIPENHWAALDIGSNSFHFIYVRQVENNIQTLYREKYPVQLASGLDENGKLNEQAINQGLEILEQLAHTMQHLPSDHCRVVATFTLRKASNAKRFLMRAKKIFPFNIEIISGHEEARLIYQGVAYNHASTKDRLVIDIGGGSTECIIGNGYQPKVLASVEMGCVSFQQLYFPNNQITATHFGCAILAAKMEMESTINRFNKVGWQQAIGTSGTIKTIFRLISEYQNEAKSTITLADLVNFKQILIAVGDINKLDFKSLKEKRRPVLCSGLAILIAVFEMHHIEKMEYCDYSLRDGVLSELMSLCEYSDIRQRSIDSLQERFSVDTDHVEAVTQVASVLFRQLQNYWSLSNGIYQKLLNWAIQVHEIGLDINSSGFHRHGAYILNNSDLAGFNQEQQTVLAWLVCNHRKKVTPLDSDSLDVLDIEKIYQIVAILRLAVIFQQQRGLLTIPTITVRAQGELIYLQVKQQWLQSRELIAIELSNELSSLQKLGIFITLEAI